MFLQWWLHNHNQRQNNNQRLTFNETTVTQTATTGSNTCSVIGKAMATVTLNKKYPFEVWLTSVGIAPVFFLLITLVKGELGLDIAVLLLLSLSRVFPA